MTMSSNQTADQETFYDSYGRPIRVAIASSAGWYLTDSCYDPTGRLQYQSTPYVSSAENPSGYNCSSSNATQLSYDALGRKTTIGKPDNSTVSLTYANRSVQVATSPGMTRIMGYDVLGHLLTACEVSSNSSMPGSGTPGSCGTDFNATGFLTSYAYNLSAHTTTVTQGAQTRVFTTDAAGRTTQVVEPESGTTNYSYAYNGTGLAVTRTRPQANQTNASTLTTTTTQYDSLGRTVSVTYNDNLTTNKGYLYDKAYSGDLIKNKGNVIGQMSNFYTQTPSGALITAREMVYDIMGRTTETKDCIPGYCGQAANDVYVGIPTIWPPSSRPSNTPPKVTAGRLRP